LEELNSLRRVDPPNFKVAYAFSAIPARYALERGQWAEAARLPFPPGHMEIFPWERFRWAEAHIHFARALGAARIGDTALARKEIDELANLKQGLSVVKGEYVGPRQVEMPLQVAPAWLLQAERKPEEALRTMRAAA